MTRESKDEEQYSHSCVSASTLIHAIRIKPGKHINNIGATKLFWLPPDHRYSPFKYFVCGWLGFHRPDRRLQPVEGGKFLNPIMIDSLHYTRSWQYLLGMQARKFPSYTRLPGYCKKTCGYLCSHCCMYCRVLPLGGPGCFRLPLWNEVLF